MAENKVPHLYLEKEIGKYIVTITSCDYDVENFYEHKIIVAKQGKYEQVYLVQHTKKKWYEPFNLFEEEYLFTDGVGRDVWENSIREMQDEFLKIKYNRKKT